MEAICFCPQCNKFVQAESNKESDLYEVTCPECELPTKLIELNLTKPKITTDQAIEFTKRILDN